MENAKENVLMKVKPIKLKSHKNHFVWVIYILPAFLVYFIFMAFPLFNSMRLSLYTGDGLIPDIFVGFDNYKELFFNPFWRDRFINAFKNTCIFFAIHMLIQNSLGLLFANFLASPTIGRDIYRTIIFIPATVSILVSGFVWKLILNPKWGAINIFLTKIGLEEWALPWLGDPKLALVVISLVSVWQWVGLPTMIFLAGLQAIPEQLYEAASIDGASGWDIFWRIKFPLLVPVMGIVGVLTFVGNFNAFDIIYAMAGSRGAPNFSTDILGSFFFRAGIAGEHPVAQPDVGIGASIATIIFFILFTVILSWKFLSKKAEQ
ncbi:MAG: sugar ABC transporter permease [Spirochaetes bacterium]|nr:sugar ABC transporter permease [Spirochaetota bacterium]